MTSYLLRVRPTADGYSCTLRQLANGPHPEDLAGTDVVATGIAHTAPAAMLAAILNARLPEIPAEPRRPLYGI